MGDAFATFVSSLTRLGFSNDHACGGSESPGGLIMIRILRCAFALAGLCAAFVPTPAMAVFVTYAFNIEGRGESVNYLDVLGTYRTFTSGTIAFTVDLDNLVTSPGSQTYLASSNTPPYVLTASTTGLSFSLPEFPFGNKASGFACFSNPSGGFPTQSGNIVTQPGCGAATYSVLQFPYGQQLTGSVTSIDVYAGQRSGPSVQITSFIPEPVTWAMTLIGFGAVGATARRRARYCTVAAKR